MQVRKIAQFLGVPENVVLKKSSPHLWKDHEAEDELGIQYEEVDSILYCLFDKKQSIDETQKNTQISREKIEKIQQLYINSEHKRLPAQKPDSE